MDRSQKKSCANVTVQISCRCSPIRQLRKSLRVLVCLAYPCNEERWLSLQTRNLLLHRASLPLTQRRVDLVLVAFPLSTRLINEAVTLMAEEIRRLTA